MTANGTFGLCDRVACVNRFCGPPAAIFTIPTTSTTTTTTTSPGGATDPSTTTESTTITTTSTTVESSTTLGAPVTLPPPGTGAASCQLTFGCECILGDKCAERLRCEKGVCVDDPNALVPDADDWDVTVVRGPVKDCGCATSGRGGRSKLEIFTKDGIGRTVHVVGGEPEFDVRITNELTGATFEPSRRRRALGYSNGTALAFLQFDEPAPYTVVVVATHKGQPRELDRFAVTACAAGAKLGETASCACLKSSAAATATCSAPLKCNATRNQCFDPAMMLSPPAPGAGAGGLSTGIIVGIAIGALCSIVLLLLIAFMGLRVAQARNEARYEHERQHAIKADAMMAGTSQAYRDMLGGPASSEPPVTIVLPDSVNTAIPLPPRPAPTRALPTPKTYGNLSDVTPQAGAPKTYGNLDAVAPPPPAAGAPKTYGSTSEAMAAGAQSFYGGSEALLAGHYGSTSRVVHTHEQYSSTTMALAALPPRPMPAAVDGGAAALGTVPRRALPPRPNLPPPVSPTMSLPPRPVLDNH